MSVALTPYPEYRDSGIDWLGEVPRQWESVKTKYLFRERIEKGFPGEQLLAATQTKGVVRKEDFDNRTVLALKDLHLLKLVRAGDFVISLRSFQGGIEYAHYQGIISPAYTVLSPAQRANPAFFAPLLKSKPYIENLSLYVTGIRQGQNIDYVRLSRSLLPVPPSEDQTAIVAFLAHFDRRTSRLIRAKRRQIELLNEQKQAIIHQAVTRGLDPNVRLKPSGIDWLGDVPAHWEMTPLKFVAKVQTGVTMGKNYGSSHLETRPYLRVANVQNGYLDLKSITTVQVPLSEAVSSELRPGDVLMTEGGDIDKLGRGCIWTGEIPGCLHQNHVFAVRVDHSKLLPGFLTTLMISPHGRSYFQLTAKKTTNLASTNSTTLKSFPVFLPKIDEQQRILSFVADESSELDAAIKTTLREIELLREYRTRLIADVVTGKLDVRGVALPADDEPSDTLDEVEPEADETADVVEDEAGEE